MSSMMRSTVSCRALPAPMTVSMPPGSRSRGRYQSRSCVSLTSSAIGLVACRATPGRPPHPITSDTAASLKTPHTLAVVRAHLAFAADARRLGHEHGPWDWTPEVSHSIGEGERLVADAVMYYTVIESEQRRKLRAFVEVDRTTMSSERLAVKLIEYARLFQYEAQPVGRRRPAAAGPAWLRWYPVFPRVLFVLTGASLARLDDRMSDLQAMVAQHPLVAALAREVRLGAAILEDIEQHGPAQAVWVPLVGGKPRPWIDL
ncbi:replication-relaxation family protein [Streptomyces mirabilis]|uniref:replication-relaxation family protein n=1 Tax=Streptomyces mirabilis TaxID=68239 RepID=UPI0036A060F9